MKSFALCILLIACVVAQESRLSGVDIDTFLNNKRAYEQIYKCLMDEGPCSPVGKEVKDRMPQAIATTCGNCTPSEKKLVRKAINAMIKTHKDDWDKLVKKYDPKGEHIAALQPFLQEH